MTEKWEFPFLFIYFHILFLKFSCESLLTVKEIPHSILKTSVMGPENLNVINRLLKNHVVFVLV